MKRRTFLRRLVASIVALGAWPAHSARAEGERYTTRGTIKSFGKNRSYVSIAHEKIPGFMDAMTMAFKPRSAAQLAGFAVGDRVAFTFLVTAEGDHVLDLIVRQ